MNENSGFKSKSKKEKLIENDDILKADAPLFKGDKSKRENAMVFTVFNPNKQEGEKYQVMSFNKKKKKSNKE